MSVTTDARILWQLAFGRVDGATHAERLESFYRQQASGYDHFRRRLLRGRQELYASIDVPQGGTWIELGGGTAANLEYLGPEIAKLSRIYVVDLSRSLLQIARQRVAAKAWSNVTCVEADATGFELAASADVVVCSYSLTMIPDWFAVVEQARRLLRPGGIFAAVDFYVARKYPPPNRHRHHWWTRNFWPVWFAFDNVHLSGDHLPYLEQRFDLVSLSEHRAPVPYLPGMRVPYYRFVGQKPAV